jgi:hypothetical protein
MFGIGESSPPQRPSVIPFPSCSANCPYISGAILGPGALASMEALAWIAAAAGEIATASTAANAKALFIARLLLALA